MANMMQQTINRMRLRSLERTLRKINQLSDTMAEKTDAELQKQTVVFKAALKNGKSLDDILPQAYATAREASKRVLGIIQKMCKCSVLLSCMKVISQKCRLEKVKH